MLPIPTLTLETYSPCPAGFHWSEQALSILLRSLSLDPLLDSHLFVPQGSVGFRLLQEAFFACLLPASVLDKCCPPSPATIYYGLDLCAYDPQSRLGRTDHLVREHHHCPVTMNSLS